MPHAHILVVDDDRRIRDMLSRFLHDHDFTVSTAADGVQMWGRLDSRNVDLILLDLNLPEGKDGVDLAREVRMKLDIPIVMLSSRNDVIDRIVGMEVGADDYIAKPFHLREVLARIKAVLRRMQHADTASTNIEKILHFDGWSLDLSRRKLTDRSGQEVELTTAEFDMISILLAHAGRVLTRDFLMETTRSKPMEHFDRSIDGQIARLRKKIEIDSRHPKLIKSVRGVGYVFAATVYDDTRPEARRS